MTVVAVVQARMGSTRLPGKVLRRVADQAVLTHVIARARRVPGVDAVMVATTESPGDDVVVNLCRGAGARWVRGPERDVLARYALAAARAGADIVLRLTADCPLLDPAVAGEIVAALRASGADYASNVHPATWYDGTDAEAFTRAALDAAVRDAGPDAREHVTTYLYRSGRFRTVNVACPGADGRPDVKLSVDTAADLARVAHVFARLPSPAATGWRDTVAAYDAAYPPPVARRALAIYGPGDGLAAQRAAYADGVAAGAAGEAFGANPYSTEAPDRARRTAWLLGWEDAGRFASSGAVSTREEIIYHVDT